MADIGSTHNDYTASLEKGTKSKIITYISNFDRGKASVSTPGGP